MNFHHKKKPKKAQAWGFDLIIAAVIFLVGVIFLYLYTINYPSGEEETLQNLQQEGELVADSLLSEGSPVYWNTSNVVRIGLLTDSKINQTKLDRFNAIPYAQAKSLFRTRNEYYIQIEETLIGPEPETPENLVKITRVVVYNNNITTMNIQIWN